MGSDGSRQSIANQLECQTLQIRLQQPRNQSSRRETSLPARGVTRSLSLVRFLVARCVATARLPRGPNRGWLPLAHGRYFPILASLGSAAKQTKQPMSIEHKASTSPTPPLVIALLPKYLCCPSVAMASVVEPKERNKADRRALRKLDARVVSLGTFTFPPGDLQNAAIRILPASFECRMANSTSPRVSLPPTRETF